MPRFIFILLICIPFLMFGQNQDCNDPQEICSEFFQQPSPSPGQGFQNDLTINYSGCLDNGENNSNWYFFTIQTGGDLLFDITPDASADYDFALFRLSTPGGATYTCSDIASGALSDVRCNFSGVSQAVTGLRNPFTNTDASPSGPPFSAPISVIPGETFLLIVDKFSSGQVGYSLDFTPSTASIIDITPPEIDNVDLGQNCEPKDTIEVFFSEPVLCSTLILGNISVSGPQQVAVIDMFSTECSGVYARSVTIVVDPPIVQGGNYTIDPKDITDQCGNYIDSVNGKYPFTVFEIPEAIDSFELATGCLADTFFFFNISEGNVSTVLWDFGDGTTSSQSNPVHIYDTLGDYTVTLTVTSPDNCSNTTTRDITVVNSFRADFTLSSDNVCVGEEIQFMDQTRGGANTWEWDFGDGSTSNAQNPTHIYQNTGTFIVKLLASDAFTPGCAPDSVSVSVEVFPGANASFSVEDTACQSQFVNLDSISQASTITRYSWDFGNNSTSSSSDPEFFYAQTGNYTIQLIVEDEFCGTDTSSESLYVKPSPQFSLGNDTSICISDEYTLRITDSEVDGIRWSDGSTQDFLVVTDFPAQVSVEVLKNGCTTTDQVFVGAKPDGCYIVNIPSGFSPNGDGLNDLLRVLPTRILDFELRIYNRWGELLYENPGMFNQGWDGTYDGEPQDAGVYTYFIKATGMDGRTIRQSGNITLLR